jgi:LPS sulfotransferase NodH
MTSILPPHSFYLLSYPRSGNTWLLSSLTMLLNCVAGEAYTQNKQFPERHGELGPDFNFRCEPRQRPDQPICIKSHDNLAVFRAQYPAAPVIYLARDARDCLLSFYFFRQAYPTLNAEEISTTRIHGTEVQLSRGSHDPVFRADEFADFLRVEAPLWAAHVVAARREPVICFLTYEELKANFVPTLIRIAEFLQLPMVRPGSEVEKTYCTGFTKVFSGNSRDFFRRGQVGDWKNWYQPTHARLLDSLVGRELRELGFESDPNWASRSTSPSLRQK